MSKSQIPRNPKRSHRKRGRRLLGESVKRNLLGVWWLLGLVVVALLVSAVGAWLVNEGPSKLKDFLSH